jgi:hypothetical protein
LGHATADQNFPFDALHRANQLLDTLVCTGMFSNKAAQVRNNFLKRIDLPTGLLDLVEVQQQRFAADGGRPERLMAGRKKRAGARICI